MFVFRTDMGYISGELHRSLRFHFEKDKARKFTAEQIKAFGDGFAADLHDWYKCEEIYLEQIEDN